MSQTSEPPASPQARTSYRPGVADLLFLLIALMVMRGARHTLLDDPGMGWHLRNIDAMLASGGWLTEDPFTDPGSGPPAKWYANQWLGELPYYLGWKWAGLEGIAAVNAVVIAMLAGILYRILLADGLPWPMALLWTALGAMGTSCSWNARPNTFTLVGILVTARACVLLHEGTLSRRAGLGLMFLFVLWANAHGGFVAGLATILATGCIEGGRALAALDPQERIEAWKRTLDTGLLGAGAFLATLVNPYGVDLYRWVFQLLGDPFFMGLHQEWRSPDFHSPGAMRYELLLLLFPIVLGLTQRRPHLVELGLAVMWLHFALTGFRYVALWVVVVVPMLARSSLCIPYLYHLAARWQLSAGQGSLFHTPSRKVSWTWSLSIALVLLGGVKVIHGRFAVHKQEILASEALDRLIAHASKWQEQHGRRPVFFHSYNWGGYLTWHGWPELLNGIDDRNEVQGETKIKRHLDTVKAGPGWQEHLAGVDLVCIETDTPLARVLGQDRTHWRQIDRDEYAVTFERRSAGK